jgi:sugar lactone lactonase YvrE
MKIKLFAIIVIAHLLPFSNEAQKVDQAYDAPDQVVWHAASNTWFVSNLGGGISLEKDGNGWISRTDAKGNVIAPFWIGKKEGMHAPSGMTITDEHLYVVDRDGVYIIDIAKQKVSTFIPINDGSFLNDIARASNGDLYVSDFFGNKIYKIAADTKKPEIWIESERLEAPDGLYMEDDSLIVASWGVLSKPNSFDTSKLGDLLSVDLKTKKISVLVKEVGNLEGIAKAGKHYYITDWASGKLLKVNAKKGEVIEFISGLKNPTDPNFSKELNTLAFPQHGTNQVLFIKF